MSDTILAALISAVASILAAVLSRTRLSHSPRARAAHDASKGRRTGWYVILGLLVIFFALTPGLVHPDHAGNNFLLIPPVTILLAIAAPIAPLMSASLVLGLFASNWILGPISNRIAGTQAHTEFLSFDLPLLGLAFANAAIVAGICALRLRFWGRPAAPPADEEDEEDTSLRNGGASMAFELEKLGELHATGVLNTEEFQRAKEKLLGEERR